MTTTEPSRLIARIAWTVPIALLALSFHQVNTAQDLKRTLESGEEARAAVTRYDRSDRKDVTHVELDLEARLSDGTVFRKEHLALPYSIGHRVEEESLDVRIFPGASQEVVISSIVSTQIGIAWSNAAMAFVAFLMALTGVIAWNLYLRSTKNQNA